MSFTYTQSGPNPVGTLNLNSAHLKLTYQDKKLIFFNNVSLGGSGSNIVASNSIQAPGFQFANSSANGIVYASNGVMSTAGSGFTIAGDTLTVPNLTLTGNLQVNGTVTTVNTTTLVITDPIVQIGSNITDTTNVGLIFTSGPSFANVAFGFTPASNTMILTGTASSAYGTDMDVTSQVNLAVNGILTANAFIGDGGLLSNISAVATSNLQEVTTNGNVTENHVTLGGLTTTDAKVNDLGVSSNGGVSVLLRTEDGNSGASAGHHTVAIGNYAATTDQQYGATAVGNYAGYFSQGFEATAIGDKAGRGNQGCQGVAIGHRVGYEAQGSQSVAIGAYAAQDSQGIQAIAVGVYTGQNSQGQQAIAVGYYAGQYNQSSSAVALGTYTGQTNQGSSSVAIGTYAGHTYQDYNATAIGNYAGTYSQGYEATAIGNMAGESNQGSRGVAIGHRSGESNQGGRAVAIGQRAGNDFQNYGAVAIGSYAGYSSQGSSAVAIGINAGESNQGSYSVAIGTNAGQNSQADNSIVLNASGNSLDTSNAGFYVNPVRYVAGGSSNVLGYNTSTGEIFDTGSGGSGASTLQEVTDLGATSNNTVTLTNSTTGLDVSSNVIIGGNISMPGGNMNAYSVSLMSAAIDTLNANEINVTALGVSANIVAHGNVLVDTGVFADTVSANEINTNSLNISGNILAHGNVLVDGRVIAANITANTISANVIIASNFIGDGSGLTNINMTSNLQQVTNLGATSNVTVRLTNATTGLNVSSNVIIGGNISMPGGNMNAYSVSLTSAAIDTLNANQINVSALGVSGNILAHSNVIVDDGIFASTIDSNIIKSNALVTKNILADDASVTGDLTVDGVTTVQILKFTPYSGIDPDTGNASVIATASGGTVTVSAAGVVYGSNVINLSGYTSPITAFNLTVDANAQIYLFAPGVSVNTTSTATVKYTNPTPITNSNVLFHVTTIAYAGFSVVNAIVVN